jgi:hypothetical protein
MERECNIHIPHNNVSLPWGVEGESQGESESKKEVFHIPYKLISGGTRNISPFEGINE